MGTSIENAVTPLHNGAVSESGPLCPESDHLAQY
jgi:hypothetical protein